MFTTRFAALMTVLVASLAQAQEPNNFSGTWSGQIAISAPGGKTNRDTAVLIIEQKGTAATGSMGRTIDQQTPFTNGSIEGNRLKFYFDAVGGLEFTLILGSGTLLGSAVGTQVKAEVHLQPAPGLVPQAMLAEQIIAADREAFEAFGNCDIPAYRNRLSSQLEFYHDRTGRTNFEENVESLQKRCAEDITLRRELVGGTFLVNRVPGHGAITAGTHRFYSRQPDGSERLDATAQFTCIWIREAGTWKLARIISYGHR